MTPADIAALRAGHCLAVIPETFIACGEGGNYCSETCRLRTLLAEACKIASCLNRRADAWDRWDPDVADRLAAIAKDANV